MTRLGSVEAIAAELDELQDISGASDDSDADPDFEPEFEGFESEDEPEEVPEDLYNQLDEMVIEEDEDEDEEGTSVDAAVWSDYSNRSKVFPFTGDPGLKINLDSTATPFQVFQTLLTNDIIDYIVEQTNLYAHQIIELGEKTSKSRHSKWHDTTREEMKLFFGMILYMGLMRAGSLKDYWRRSIIYENAFCKFMSRNRFELLLACIHFSDNTQINREDRLGKIQPLLDKLLVNYQAAHVPEEDVVIDETLIPWRGRLIFRQYIPSKAHKYGIKLFKLCSLKGYTYNIMIYSGKSQDKNKGVGLAQFVCTKLMSELLDQGRTLYVDNFYTSYELAHSFLKRKTHVVGTLRANKKNMPQEVMKAKLKKGEMVAKEDQNGIVVLKWADARDVRLLSTKHKPEMVDVEERRRSRSRIQTEQTGDPQPSTSTVQETQIQRGQEDMEESPATRSTRKRKRPTQKPAGILAYNQGKVGIDLSDQLGSYLSALRKGIKWYRKLATEILLGTTIINAYILYKELTNKRIPLKTFKEDILLSLVQSTLQPSPSPTPSTEQHILITKMNDKGQKIRRSCKSCYKKASEKTGREELRKNLKMVYTYCNKCPNKPYMCRPCFEADHVTKSNK